MAQVRVAEDELQRMFTVMKENLIDCGTAGFTDVFFFICFWTTMELRGAKEMQIKAPSLHRKPH